MCEILRLFLLIMTFTMYGWSKTRDVWIRTTIWGVGVGLVVYWWRRTGVVRNGTGAVLEQNLKRSSIKGTVTQKSFINFYDRKRHL